MSIESSKQSGADKATPVLVFEHQRISHKATLKRLIFDLEKAPRSNAKKQITFKIYEALEQLHQSHNHSLERTDENSKDEGFYFVDIKCHVTAMMKEEKVPHFDVENSLLYLYWTDLLYGN